MLDKINLSFYPDAKIGVIGVNGSGKSTLLRIMAGIDKEYDGEAWAAQGATIGYLPQEPQLNPKLNVRENIRLGLSAKQAILDRYNELMANYSDAIADEAATLQDQIDAHDLWNIDSQIEQAMEALRCPDGDASITNLSGGELRRIALCRLLLEQPDLLLLDEPTNHLDAETVGWLEKHLQSYPGAVLLITHDRYFLDNVTGWILELDRGRGIPYQGNYSSWLNQKRQRLALEDKDNVARQKALEREAEWISASPKARQAKSRARINAYDDLIARNMARAVGNAQIVIPSGPRLGEVVIEVSGLSKGFDDRLLVEDMTFTVPPGAIVGIIGANGVGKSTLFNMITGQERPDIGAIRLGETVKLAFVGQSRDILNNQKTVWEEISEGQEIIELGRRTIQSRAYVSSFNFKGSDQQKKVSGLSGGERNRLHLAKIIKAGANVLLLDEPTNDLDVETLSALEDALEDFAGCALIISHDRFFLDRIATHILAFEGNSKVEWFEGNFADYENDKIRRLGAQSVNPKRIKYKKLHQGHGY